MSAAISTGKNSNSEWYWQGGLTGWKREIWWQVEREGDRSASVGWCEGWKERRLDMRISSDVAQGCWSQDMGRWLRKGRKVARTKREVGGWKDEEKRETLIRMMKSGRAEISQNGRISRFQGCGPTQPYNTVRLKAMNSGFFLSLIFSLT